METLFKMVVTKMGAPPIFSREAMEQLAELPSTPTRVSFPDPTFTRARKERDGRKLPQAIAHRGYKAKFPENTMSAFKGAVQVGVHALETDVHLSKDGVVVLSHDATLQRCFGEEKKLLDCDWKYLQEVRTIKEPHESLPRLEQLIEYLAQPELSNIWLLLDIKMDNKPDDIMRRMAEAIARVPPPPNTKWEERILLGCWAAKFIPLCHKYFPRYPITNIGFSIPYSRQFFAVPNCSFNILQASLVSPAGRKFIKEVKARDRAIYSWTVNSEKEMDWCIRRGLDGVITDDPEKFLTYRKHFDINAKPPDFDWQTIMNFVRINVFAYLFGLLFWKRHGFKLDKKFLAAETKTRSS